ncbi:MAG: AI-2E family transporter [Bacteroidia bacterium]|nr:AI-2E family transporter [Bacteroidia bacterium]
MADKDRKIATVFLGILVLIALGGVLVWMQSVVLPLVIAVLLSYIFKPVVLFLRTKRVPNALALVVVFLVIAGLFFGFGSILYSTVNTFVKAFPRYQDRLTLLVYEGSRIIESLAADAGIRLDGMTLTDVIDVSAIGSIVSSSAGSFVSLLSNLVLVLLFMFFILAGSGDVIAKLKTAVSLKQASTLATMIETVDLKVRRYLIAKTLISLLTGAVTSLILLILGVDFALLWGFLTFLLNFIPTVGSIVAVFFPFLFSLLQFDTFTVPLLTLILLSVAQNTIGNVLEPRYLAHSLNLSPLLVLVALLFWGWIWGIWGMILSVPIMSTIKIICENVDSLKPVAALMSGSVDGK